MSRRLAVRRNRAIRAAAGVILAGLLAAGCGHGPAAPAGPSVQSCASFGINAIEHHVTVTSLPAACRGLTRAQVNYAVGRAIYAMTATVHGKARRRALTLKLSPLLAHLVSTVPAQSGQAPVPAPAAGRASGPSLGLAALISWLITVGLGAWMMTRWVARGGFRRGRRDDAVLPPSVTFAHFGLALAGLLAWIAYLATGLAGLAWAACGLLLPAAALGMTLVFLGPARDAATAPDITGLSAAELSFDEPATPRLGALVIAAHIAAASITILLAVLAAIGSG
jgi:hypothetical protein